MKKKVYLHILLTLLISSATKSSYGQQAMKTRTFTLLREFEKNGTVRINSTGRPVEIKSWNQASIKLEVIIPDSLAKGMDDNTWPEKVGIKLNKFSNRADITLTGGTVKPGLNSAIPSAIPLVMSDAVVPKQNKLFQELLQLDQNLKVDQSDKLVADQNLLLKTNTLVTIYIPETADLNLLNKYSSATITGSIRKGYINLENSTLDGSNATSLRLIARFSTINFDNIDELEADISNTNLRVGHIRKLDIESTRSTVEYESGTIAYIRSNLDNSYTIEKLDTVAGRLLYSSIRLEQLNRYMDFDGNNYDLKIRNISPDAEFIKINNAWANLRLPLNSLTNYSITFDGKNCAVFAPFEIVPDLREETSKKVTGSLDEDLAPVILKNSQRPNAPRYFSAKNVNISGKHTRFLITCQQCTVDFK
jgi:hypothetical protein